LVEYIKSLAPAPGAAGTNTTPAESDSGNR
jgi:hypothetical protein